ncbi:hypothetical protein KIN20_005067 [Parelaphostrongylus tenuis]|uniref:Uncharacterized protein n=1 Tax=Parelaphostrongylus tenuis TaxID=148309 RepID=A0AAD5MKT5_PARTN|nr:hypothetical protein KIN20_005067 [Parelaphostrongylus tenuis]
MLMMESVLVCSSQFHGNELSAAIVTQTHPLSLPVQLLAKLHDYLGCGSSLLYIVAIVKCIAKIYSKEVCLKLSSMHYPITSSQSFGFGPLSTKCAWTKLIEHNQENLPLNPPAYHGETMSLRHHDRLPYADLRTLPWPHN